MTNENEKKLYDYKGRKVSKATYYRLIKNDETVSKSLKTDETQEKKEPKVQKTISKKRPIEDELVLAKQLHTYKLLEIEYEREYDTNKIIKMAEIYRDRYKNKNIFITKRLLRTLNRDEKSVRSALFFNK